MADNFAGSSSSNFINNFINNYNRRQARVISVGGVSIGGDNQISIQSMTTTKTADVSKTAEQINALSAAGCDIARVAVPDAESANALSDIKRLISVPIVADIHFDWRLALMSISAGADKLRINPGNIGGSERLKQVADAAKSMGVPIRVGVNSGSLEPEILRKYGKVTAEGLAESAIKNAALLENFDFSDIIISIKASDVSTSIEAYELVAAKTDYPLHVGITEAGPLYAGSIKSAVGIGAILSRGIGDTIRVSLTADPLSEILCAKEILKSLGLRRFGAELISCPTCGRTRTGMIELANRVETYLSAINKPIRVAVMGCAVNGPGEAREADVGVACGDGNGVIFKKGRIIRSVSEDQIFESLVREIEEMID